MPDFLNNQILLVAVGAFIGTFMYQVLIKGPKEAKRKARIREYLDRLDETSLEEVKLALAEKDSSKGMAILQAKARIGTAEAKELYQHLSKTF